MLTFRKDQDQFILQQLIALPDRANTDFNELIDFYHATAKFIQLRESKKSETFANWIFPDPLQTKAQEEASNADMELFSLQDLRKVVFTERFPYYLSHSTFIQLCLHFEAIIRFAYANLKYAPNAAPPDENKRNKILNPFQVHEALCKALNAASTLIWLPVGHLFEIRNAIIHNDRNADTKLPKHFQPQFHTIKDLINDQFPKYFSFHHDDPLSRGILQFHIQHPDFFDQVKDRFIQYINQLHSALNLQQ